MRKSLYMFLVLLMAVTVLTACTPTATPTSTLNPATPTVAQVQATKPVTVAPTQAPTQAPTVAAKATAAPKPSATPMPTRQAVQAGVLILSTTTSTNDSGLLQYLLPDFEKQFNCKVQVISVGSGQAIKLGRDGNVDVLLVHSRADEDKFVADGAGINRVDVMYNDFVIVGPKNDPAGIKGMPNAAAALKQIADKQAKFVARGDGSGTDVKEKDLWKAVSMTPSGSWYNSTGQGMGAVLSMANEQQGYTLADRATYLAQQKKLDLVVLVEGDKALFNPYGCILVNPAKYPVINADLATKFQDWLISLPTQQKIADFGKAEFGQALFVPDAQPWRDAHK
jgi:tungstate transport system substrate-binding protein